MQRPQSPAGCITPTIPPAAIEPKAHALSRACPGLLPRGSPHSTTQPLAWMARLQATASAHKLLQNRVQGLGFGAYRPKVPPAAAKEPSWVRSRSAARAWRSSSAAAAAMPGTVTSSRCEAMRWSAFLLLRDSFSPMACAQDYQTFPMACAQHTHTSPIACAQDYQTSPMACAQHNHTSPIACAQHGRTSWCNKLTRPLAESLTRTASPPSPVQGVVSHIRCDKVPRIFLQPES